MAGSRDDLWGLAHAERTALAEDLSGLAAEQWQHGTLCGQWNVEDVVAHLTAAASLNQWRWARSMLGARFRVDTHNQRRMVEHRGNTPPKRSTDSAPSSIAPPPPRDTPRRTSARSWYTPKTFGSRWGCPGLQESMR
jgi:hypothetical protein